MLPSRRQLPHNAAMHRRTTLTIFIALLAMACTPGAPPSFTVSETLEVPVSGPSLGVRMSSGASGQLLLSWMERRDDGADLRVSEFTNSGWAAPILVVTDPRMFVNWADLPSVTAIGKDQWLAQWLSYSADAPYAYDVRVAQSFDRGRKWTASQSPHSDGTSTEHGFVSVYPDGMSTGLIWLDGRKTINEVDEDPTSSGMTLRAATIDSDGEIRREQEIDALVCDCCQTSVAVGSKGPIAAYRNRTEDEIRDIYISRQRDGEWLAGTAIADDNWEIAGCPVNGPSIAASGDFVAVAWFTAANGVPLVKASISRNGGVSFSEPFLISDKQPSGHVDIAYLGHSVFAVSWMEAGDDAEKVQLRALASNGELGAVLTVGETNVSYNVPQMEAHDGELLLAWTGADAETSTIVSKRVRELDTPQ